MAAVLGAWLTAWLIEAQAGIGPGGVVLAVVLSLTLSRTARRAGHHAVPAWARACALPLIAVLAWQVGRLIKDHPTVGDVAFVLVLSGAVWVRRYGARWSAVGTVVSLPFIALLATPAVVASPDQASGAQWLWPAVFGLVALAWVSLVRYAAERSGFVAPTTPAPEVRRPAARARKVRVPASSRMALQLGVALGLSFALGRWLFPEHWSWVVMSCYVVCSGNRGRGDVAHKGVQRLLGALMGTASATLVSSLFPAGERWALVLLFVVMAVATWARERSYGYWAAGVTAMLALLYGYFGENGTDQLGQRLLGVLLGAAVAVAVSWFLLPVRSGDVFRRRWADALAALSGYLGALLEDGGAHEREQAWQVFDHGVRQLREIEPAYRFHRRTVHLGRRTTHPADLVAGIVEVRDALDRLPLGEPGQPAAGHRREIGAWARRTGQMRKRMRPDGTDAEGSDMPDGDEELDGDPWLQASVVLTRLDARFTREIWKELGGS